MHELLIGCNFRGVPDPPLTNAQRALVYCIKLEAAQADGLGLFDPLKNSLHRRIIDGARIKRAYRLGISPLRNMPTDVAARVRCALLNRII